VEVFGTCEPGCVPLDLWKFLAVVAVVMFLQICEVFGSYGRGYVPLDSRKASLS
jgi:hypothetical protein